MKRRRIVPARLGGAALASTLTAVAAAAAAVAVAVVGTAADAPAETPAVSSIRKVPCSGTTFAVYTDGGRKLACYAGTGVIAVSIREISLVTTGRQLGFFEAKAAGSIRRVPFRAAERVTESGPTTLVSIDITGS